jgi:hypothetical protein
MHPQPLDPSAMARRLREMPVELTPPMSWEEFQRRAEEAPVKRPARPWRRAALAAGVAGLIASLAIWTRLEHPIEGVLNASTENAELPMLAQPDLHYLQQSQASERYLARLPAEPVVMRVGTRSAVADLEDRIAWMDDVLSDERPDSDQTHVVALQHERARLVNSLAQVRFAETLVAAAQ